MCQLGAVKVGARQTADVGDGWGKRRVARVEGPLEEGDEFIMTSLLRTFLGLRRTSLFCQLSELSLLFQLSEHLQIFSCVNYLKFCSGSALFCCVLRQEPFCLFLSWKINGNVGQPRHRLKGTSAGFPAGRFPVFLGP